MRDLPILFSATMIRAILREIVDPGTGKTQTRRALSNTGPGLVAQPYRGDGRGLYVQFRGDDGLPMKAQRLRYAVGDRLYVREAWRTAAHLDKFAPKILPVDSPVFFEADAGGEVVGATGKFRQGMHMPRWASRITLIVTDVRVQRLQEISEADARAEGVLWVPGHGEITHADLSEGYSNYLNCREGFQVLWDSLNASRGFGWDANPWVAAYTFVPLLGNIDEVRA